MPPPEVKKDGEKKDSLHLREKDLENHFEGDSKNTPKDSKHEDTKDEKKDKGEKPASSRLEDNLKSDYQVMRALDLLKGWDILKKIGSVK